MKTLIVTLTLLVSAIASADPISSTDLLNSNNDFGYGNIYASRTYCANDVCNYNMNWNVDSNNSVVVLEVRGGPESGAVKLMSCEGRNGSAKIDWIRQDGAQYIFHLYSSSYCNRDIYYREREVNSVVIQEFGGGNNGYADIRAQRRNCNQRYCDYQLDWSVSGPNSVVTVVDLTNRGETVVGCSANRGSAIVNWVARNGSRYEFRLYDSNRCSSDVGYYSRPVDSIIVQEF